MSSPDLRDVVPARVLVADDDRITRELLASVLRGAGHTVEVVSDGQEAIDRAARGGFDLALLDVVMPRMSGLEACRILKGLTTETFLPVILVTVKTDTASRVDGLKIGADDYVCKPFDTPELLARIEAMLRIKRLHDHVASARERLAKLSIYDELTGLYNYRFLNTRLSEEHKRAERNYEPFACLLVDIDQLRAVNEASGRRAGDLVIVAVARAIQRALRDTDVVARYGGEEFLAILPGTHFAGATSAAEQVWRNVSAVRVEVDGRVHAPTVSVGVALYPSRDVRTKDALVRAAESALQQAKRDGGNRIAIVQQPGLVLSPALGAGSLAATIQRAAGESRTEPNDAIRKP
jgi:diguanylate cyclase (GGDEF)-like protein